MVFESIVYFVTIFTVFILWYDENKKILLVFSIWIPFMMSMIDTMFLILVKIFFNIFGIDMIYVEEFVVSICSLLFMHILGYIYNKNYKYEIKKIEYKSLILLTALIIVNTVVVLIVAKVAVIEFEGKRELLYSGAFAVVIVGVFVQLGAVFLLNVSKNIAREKEDEAKKYLMQQKYYYKY